MQKIKFLTITLLSVISFQLSAMITDNPKLGDHIYIRRKMLMRHDYSHHGVYIGDDKIIHFDGDSKENAVVCETTLNQFKNWAIDGKIRVVQYGTWKSVITIGGKKQLVNALPIFEIIERAKSKLGSPYGSGCYKGILDSKYSLLENNCEHFANWCCSGYHYSGQTGLPHVVEKVTRPVKLALIRVAKGVWGWFK